MRKHWFTLIGLACITLMVYETQAQGLHFSQYFNTPSMTNPSNTGLTHTSDYRVSGVYRNQWAKLPVPFSTYGVTVDFQAFRNQFESNWLGIGMSFFYDKAGTGNLSLSKSDLYIAYHVQAGEHMIFSVGAYAGYGARSVDRTLLTFDRQWNGMYIDPTLPNGELSDMAKTSYIDAGAGISLSIMPSESAYIRMGVGVAHVNQPKETFYSMVNKIGIRPSANLEGVFNISEYLTLSPSAYYSMQKGASELMFGTLLSILASSPGYKHNDNTSTYIYFGAYNRWADALSFLVGLGYGELKFFFSYDFSTSGIKHYNGSTGAVELGIKIEGMYGEKSKGRNSFTCPRF